MMLIPKSLLLNAILFFLTTLTRAIEIQDEINRLPISVQETLLKKLLSTSSSFSRKSVTDVAEQWCCKINPTINVVTQTRQISMTELREGRHKCGYDDCGFLGWSRCTRWCTETWIETKTGTETYTFYQQDICPHDQVTCCEHHIYLLGHCFSYTEIFENQQLLADLHQLQIVIPSSFVGK